MAKLRQHPLNRRSHEELSRLLAQPHKAIPATPRVRCGKRQAQGDGHASRRMSHLPATRPPSHDACIATGNLGLRLEAFSLAPTRGIAQPAACRGATATSGRSGGDAQPDVSLRSRFVAVHFSPAVSVQRVSSCPRARQSVASVRRRATNFFPGAHKAPLNHAIAARHGGMMLL